MCLLPRSDRRHDCRGSEKQRDALVIPRWCDEHEDRDADGGEQAGVQNPTPRDLIGLAAPDRERDDPGFEVTVVRDDRPTGGVRAATEPALQRQDEDVSADDPWF